MTLLLKLGSIEGDQFAVVRWYFWLLKDLRSLSTATVSNLESFAPLMKQYNLTAFGMDPTPGLTPFNLALHSLCTSLSSTDFMPAFILVPLVKATNLHMTIARWTMEMDENAVRCLAPLLHYILSLDDPCTSTWIEDLKRAGYDALVAISCVEQPRETFMRLFAFFKFQHYRVPSTFERGLELKLAGMFASLDPEAGLELARTRIAGVYHLAGCHLNTWHEDPTSHVFASFQVEPNDVQLCEARADLLQLNDVLGAFNIVLPPRSEAPAVKFTGRGKIVDSAGVISLFEVHGAFIDGLTGIHLLMNLGNAKRSVFGRCSDVDFSGSMACLDVPLKHYGYEGAFSCWKSALPNTEPNWDLHTADLEALSKLRQDGIEARSWNTTLAEKRWFKTEVPFGDFLKKHGATVRFTRSISAAMYHTRNRSVVFRYVSSVSKEDQSCLAPLPLLARGRYETVRGYQGRCMMIAWVNSFQTAAQRYLTTRHFASHQSYSDILIAISGCQRLYRRLLNDLVAVTSEENATESRKRLDCFQYAYGLQANEKLMNLLIEACENSTKAVMDLMERVGDNTSVAPSTSDLKLLDSNLVEMVYLLAENQSKDTVKSAQSIQYLIDWLMQDDSSLNENDAATTSLSSPDAATSSSALCRAIITESERENYGSAYSRLHRTWSKRLGASNCTLEPVQLGMSPELFAYFLEGPFRSTRPALPPPEPLLPMATSETNVEQSPSIARESLSVSTIAKISLGIIAVAAIASTAYVLGRVWTKKSKPSL